MTDSINSLSSLSAPSTSAASELLPNSRTSLGQDEFMKLFVAQVNAQNPLEPQDNGDLVAQMSQFGMLNGIADLNKSFESVASNLQSNQALQASTLVGQNVSVRADAQFIEAGQAIKGSVNIESPIQNLKIILQNAQGEVVNQYNLGTQSPGFKDFTLDGLDATGQPLAAGSYLIKSEGASNNKNVALAMYLTANVDSVTLGSDSNDIALAVKGIGEKSLNDIHRVMR